MANYYTQFSFKAVLPPIAIDYALKLYDLLQKGSESMPNLESWAGAGDTMSILAKDMLHTMGEHVGFYMETEDEDGLWFNADEDGTPEHVATFLQTVLEECNLDDVIGFTWANTCEKPHLDAFSGGAVVVSRHETQWHNAMEWMMQTVNSHRQPANPLLTAAKALLESLQTPEQLQQVYWEYRDNLQKAVAAAETEVLQQRYLAAKGVRCPVCGEIHIEGRGNWNVEENIATQSMSCTRCDLAWVDVYTLSGMANLEVPHE